MTCGCRKVLFAVWNNQEGLSALTSSTEPIFSSKHSGLNKTSREYIGIVIRPQLADFVKVLSLVKPMGGIAVGFRGLSQSLIWMEGEELIAVFHRRDSLCALRISLCGRKEMMFSRSSGVLKTALRAASVVMLRVLRRSGATKSTALQAALHFCSPG